MALALTIVGTAVALVWLVVFAATIIVGRRLLHRQDTGTLWPVQPDPTDECSAPPPDVMAIPPARSPYESRRRPRV